LKRAHSIAILGLVLLTACSTDQTIVTPDPHLERMVVQPRRNAYTEDSFFANGMTMQHPPLGTMPASDTIERPVVTSGLDHGAWADRIPVDVDRGMVERGRRAFDVTCATCHGVTGDGRSVVSGKMRLRAPPSLVAPPIADQPPGRIFGTITQGYGLMPSYASQLSSRERWEVVAYVLALRMSRGTIVAELPPNVCDELAKEAP
jgi:mono/diheme cytochrome c family protein